MADETIAAIRKDERFESWLLVRAAEQRTASNGKQYLDMTLGDRTGNINAKMWDGTVPPPPPGSVVRVRGTGNEFQGRMQLRVEKLTPAAPGDDVDMAALVPCAPGDPAQMMAGLRETVAAMADRDLAALTGALLDAAGEPLLTYPAAKTMHHAQRSGLLYHITTMLKAARALCGVYPYLNADLLYAGVIVHDLAKLKELDADALGGVRDYTTDGKLLGHLVRGVVDIEQAARACGAAPQTALLLQHMVLSHHGKAEFGSPVPPRFPEAEVLHTLDTLDARLDEMTDALQRTLEGGFSEKVWGLENRQLYRIPGADADGDAAQKTQEGEPA
ncbi:MAG: HD domain-containing protein [Oscillospiraceae bacterium]|jgi:3'-5' exoribonuclease|nr:HD domain-containing protein [Oscillospiraceae bacterium]